MSGNIPTYLKGLHDKRASEWGVSLQSSQHRSCHHCSEQGHVGSGEGEGNAATDCF